MRSARVVLLGLEVTGASVAQAQPVPPQFWSAFVLSGDWR
jgi:hypothetical protein